MIESVKFLKGMKELSPEPRRFCNTKFYSDIKKKFRETYFCTSICLPTKYFMPWTVVRSQYRFKKKFPAIFVKCRLDIEKNFSSTFHLAAISKRDRYHHIQLKQLKVK